jgi:hypothetical protein
MQSMFRGRVKKRGHTKEVAKAEKSSEFSYKDIALYGSSLAAVCLGLYIARINSTQRVQGKVRATPPPPAATYIKAAAAEQEKKFETQNQIQILKEVIDSMLENTDKYSAIKEKLIAFKSILDSISEEYKAIFNDSSKEELKQNLEKKLQEDMNFKVV